MSAIRFEWDEKKNIKNRKKHNISFEEATSVFADDHALLFGFLWYAIAIIYQKI